MPRNRSPWISGAALGGALAGAVLALTVRILPTSESPALKQLACATVHETGRAVIVQEAPRIAGFGAEISALLAERAILDLRGPVVRVTGYDVPFPFWSLEAEHIPSSARVVEAIEQVLRF